MRKSLTDNLTGKLRNYVITGATLLALTGIDYSTPAYAEKPNVKQEQTQYPLEEFKKGLGKKYDFFSNKQREKLENNWPKLKEEDKRDIYTIYVDYNKFYGDLSKVEKKNRDRFGEGIRDFTDEKAENAKDKFGHMFPWNKDIRKLDDQDMSRLWRYLANMTLKNVKTPWFHFGKEED